MISWWKLSNGMQREFAAVLTPDASDIFTAVLDWIGGNLSPESVFEERDLESWAEENGYTKKLD